LQYRNTTKTIPQIADELGVDTILEGAIQRSADRVRINVQLIDAETDKHLWAETYDRELTATNIFSIQSEIAKAIADALSATLSEEEYAQFRSVPTENLAAYEAYLLGRQRLVKRTKGILGEAVEYFEKAIELDSNFALAYVGLADAYQLQVEYSDETISEWEILPKAESAIEKALQLDDHSGEAYVSLASLKNRRWNLEGAETAYKKALVYNPNYAQAYHWYGLFLQERGRYDEALAQLEKAVKLDPLSPPVNMAMGMSLELLSRFDEAMNYYHKVLEIDPKFPSIHYTIGDVYKYAYGQLDEAAVWYKKEYSLDPDNPQISSMIGMNYLELNDFTRAECWIKHSLKLAPQNSYYANRATFDFHLFRGENDQALAYAQKINFAYPYETLPLSILRDHEMNAGNYDKALALYEYGYPNLLVENKPIVDNFNYSLAPDVAYILQEMGKEEQANNLLKRVLKQISSEPRLGNNGYWLTDVQVYTLQGETDKAIVSLRQLIDEGWCAYWWVLLEWDPILRPLHKYPEFQVMVEEIKTKIANQLGRAKEMDQEGDVCVVS